MHEYTLDEELWSSSPDGDVRTTSWVMFVLFRATLLSYIACYTCITGMVVLMARFSTYSIPGFPSVGNTEAMFLGHWSHTVRRSHTVLAKALCYRVVKLA